MRLAVFNLLKRVKECIVVILIILAVVAVATASALLRLSTWLRLALLPPAPALTASLGRLRRASRYV